VTFQDSRLLVVDEEQRFGVAHKERIKQMRESVDVLTMTRRRFPRTLNMSLVGIRDMSIIETPPKDRLSIQTNVVKFDAAGDRAGRAQRAGARRQVYFVHNRVESIFSIGDLLQRLVPEARIVVGHGQMGEEELERRCSDFVERQFDVLLATTIVENGLDIPNANTIIINRADRYGLAQLYQLRGRVGRSDRPAYAYLLIPPRRRCRRWRASGWRRSRSSAIWAADSAWRRSISRSAAPGTCWAASRAATSIRRLRDVHEAARRDDPRAQGRRDRRRRRATVNLRVDLKIEDSYIPDMNQRLMIYRKVAAARNESELDMALEEARDRYGAPPPSVLNLAEYGRIRIMADRLGVESIDREGRLVVIRFRPLARIDPMRLVTVVGKWPGATLVPPVSLKLDLDAAAAAAHASVVGD
jgi:transcription-repair coupling factor (superfamily II helicase)